ncbi:hypothetical protein D3C77_557560 [compost metagenome]
MTCQFAQAPAQVVRAANRFELVVAIAFVDEQRHITGRVHGKSIEQLTAAGAALTATAVLLLEQVQATVQVQQAGAGAVSVADIEVAVIIEQRLKTLRGMAGSPVTEQVIVAGIDAAIVAQFVVDQLQGCRRQQAPRDVHTAHRVNQGFFDCVVAVQRCR